MGFEVGAAVSEMAGRSWKQPVYQRAAERVGKILTKLAPEVVTHNDRPPATAPPARAELTMSSKVYLRFAKKYHPDHGGDTKVMQDLNELWQAVQVDIGKPRV